MKSPLLLLALATALPVLSGCATAGAPNIVSMDPSALVFGAIGEHNRPWDRGRIDTIASLSGLVVIPLASEEAFGAVDVIVRLAPAKARVETYSARTRKPLTVGPASKWSYPALYRDVATHLAAEFSPHKDLYKQLMAEREGGKAVPAAAVASAPARAPVAPSAPAFESDVETPSFRLAEDETKFALVVGVEDYQSVPKAEHASR